MQSLVLLVEEVLNMYRRHQQRALSNDQQIEFHYTTLKESYDEQLIDVHCVSVS